MRVSLTRDRAVVVLVEMREELAGAHAQVAGDHAERVTAAARRGRRARPAPSSTCGPSSGRSIGQRATPRARRGCR